MEEKDAKRIQQLVQEGKMISKVLEEDFPEYEYWDIYEAAWDRGEQSAMGVKRSIANRLGALNSANKEERNRIITEIDELVWHLYEKLKASQKKLGGIRKLLNS